jgi:SPP1 family predicted phage head-tail adaptor
MTIGMKPSVGARPHRVMLQNPGPAVTDGDSGYTQTWADLVPPWVSAQILPATAKDLERVSAGTVLATATHIVSMPYHPQVTTKTRILFNGRSFSVTGVADPEERHVETIAICAEVVS